MTETAESVPVSNGNSKDTEEIVSDDLRQKIVKQLEYYFGDMNLLRDKFMQDEMKKDHGWITVETLLKFNRLNTLSSNDDTIVTSVDLANGDLLEVSDDRKKIRRSPEKPLPDNNVEYWQDVKSRSVYVKGFPKDASLDEIQSFFSPHGEMKNVVMRRFKVKDKKSDDAPQSNFKGSVFGTFSTRENAEKLIALKDLKFKDVELIVKSQDGYFKDKIDEKKQIKDSRKHQKDEIKKKEHQEVVDKKSTLFQPGMVLSATGMPAGGDFRVESIKEFFNKFAVVRWVDHVTGCTNAKIRFEGEDNTAEKVIAKAKEANEGKVLFKESELTLAVLTGEEEQDYWKQTAEDMAARQLSRHGRGRGRGGRGRGGGDRGGSRGRPRGGGRYRDSGGDRSDGTRRSPRTRSGDAAAEDASDSSKATHKRFNADADSTPQTNADGKSEAKNSSEEVPAKKTKVEEKIVPPAVAPE